jgi:hypothetical protein
VQDVQREHRAALGRAGKSARGTDRAGVVVERTGDDIELAAANENRAAESGTAAATAFEYAAAATDVDNAATFGVSRQTLAQSCDVVFSNGFDPVDLPP